MYGHTTLEWVSFLAIIIALLAFDLGVLHRKNKVPTFSKSLKYSIFYFVIALAFGAVIYYQYGAILFREYITAYLIEKSLALDNIFVFSIIFSFLAIPIQYQHRVLFWGIIGVIVLRAIFIALGATLITKFDWVLFIFAGILVLTGIKILIFINHKPNISNNPVLKFLQRNFPLTKELHKEKFLVKIDNKWHFTPLLVALILIEAMDIIFAIDSIPAVFAITQDMYIAYTSNIFAILGLRALYFCLAGIVERFVYLKYSLGIVLIFIGGKVYLNHFGMKLDALISLSITVAILASGIIVSLFKGNKSASK